MAQLATVRNVINMHMVSWKEDALQYPKSHAPHVVEALERLTQDVNALLPNVATMTEYELQKRTSGNAAS